MQLGKCGLGGKDNIGGANAGIFFRRVDGETLYGINTFADYESGKYGDFLRYGIGGELQSPYAAFAANYYLPITDDKRQGANVAFSQKGYDANLRINIPQMDYLKLRGDYYHFDGKYGDEDDKGFRYGLEVQPINDLRIGVFYDDGGEEFGGDIVYVYNFGIPQKRESAVAFSPDLFSPIVREYSQRIMTAQLGPQLRFITMAISVMTATIITPERVFTTPMTMAGMTTILTTETPTMTITRMASVNFTINIIDLGMFGGTAIATSILKHLITLPPISQTQRPLSLIIAREWYGNGMHSYLVIGGNHATWQVGNEVNIASNILITFTIIVAEGSEDFISVAITLTNENTTTVPHIITETPMTIAAMTIISISITFATSTMTIGANTGAAKVDSHLPPSFPPLSFPPLSPIMVSYGLAKNGDSWILAMVVPAFAPFPRHSRPRLREGRQRRESTAAGRRILMAQSAI